MSLTAKEFAKLPQEEQRKRYTELSQHEASLYRIFYAPIGGKKMESETPRKEYTPDERERADRQLFACMKQFHQVPENMTFEKWSEKIRHTRADGAFGKGEEG